MATKDTTPVVPEDTKTPTENTSPELGKKEMDMSALPGLLERLESLRAARAALESARKETMPNDDPCDELDFDDDDALYDDDDPDDEMDFNDIEDDDDEGPKSNAPLRKGLILRSNYTSNAAYGEAVTKSIKGVLRKNGIRETPLPLRDNLRVFRFDKSTHGVNVDARVLIEFELCNIRIEFKLVEPTLPGRQPLLDHFITEKSFPLRYGALVLDHSDGEKKLELSFSYIDAYSEAAFVRYWEALCATLVVYGKEYQQIANEEKLSSDQRALTRKLIGELAINLPARVKPEKEETLKRAEEAIGGTLSKSMKKLLALVVSSAK